MTTLAEKIEAIQAGKASNTRHWKRRHSLSRSRPTRARQISAESIQLFCSKYIELGCNGSAAYRSVHPSASKNTAKVEAHRYLTNPNVQDVLQPMLQNLFREAQIDREWAVNRMMEQADASALDYFNQTSAGQLELRDLNELSDPMRRNLKSIKIRNTKNGRSISVTVVDQQKAVGMLARFLQMFTEKTHEADAGRVGDLVEQGVKRIRASRDLDAWRDVNLDEMK